MMWRIVDEARGFCGLSMNLGDKESAYEAEYGT